MIRVINSGKYLHKERVPIGCVIGCLKNATSFQKLICKCVTINFTKLWRIGVPTRGSSSRQLSKLWYRSWVKAQYWKPLIVYTRFTIFSRTRVCPSTLISTCAYTITYLYKHLFCSKCEFIGQILSYFWTMIPGWVICQSLNFTLSQWGIRILDKSGGAHFYQIFGCRLITVPVSGCFGHHFGSRD